MLDRPQPSAKACDAVLLGFDVEGFSRTVEKAALRHGRGAGEMAAQRILEGERIATDLAHAAGFRFADALGDGAIYLRVQDRPSPREGRALQALIEELKYAHLKRTGLAVRAAWTYGQVRLTQPTAPILEHNELLWGPAVAALHETLAARARGRRRMRDDDSGRPNLSNREGEIADLTFVFLRLCHGDDWARLDEGVLNDALSLIARWAEHLNGRLERITHDEKGIHVRVGLPGRDAIERDWERSLEAPRQALRALGFDGAAAAAAGAVYRGPSEHGSTIVHGGAVNRAAKLCAAQPPGGLAVDASLADQSSRAPPVTETTVGRERELEKARLWLSSGGPRLVLLVGENGIGKSHLLRSLTAETKLGAVASIAGAPARMLDPMGAWFEALGQALRTVHPGGTDVDWASGVLEAAGHDAVTLALCARALRGVEAAPGDALVLSGGERATRTQAGMLALVDALGRETPLIVAVDDSHELDEASLELTLSVLDRGIPVGVIATCRTAASGAALADLRAHLSTLEIPLGPLSRRDINQLLAPLTTDAATLAEIVNLSGGNPFEALQAALALSEGGDGRGDRTLAAILERRLERQSPAERDVLRALSLADRDWSADDLAAISSPERPGATAEALARLVASRLIASGGSTTPRVYRPSHRLLADLVRGRTPQGLGRRLAMLAARRLARVASSGAGASVVEIAQLWAQAGSRGRAAILYERAARAAAIEGADSVRIQLMARTLALFDNAQRGDLPRRGVRWLAQQAESQWSLGMIEEANRGARLAIARARREHLPRRLVTSALAAAALRAETGQFIGGAGEIVLGSIAAARLGGSGREQIVARGRGLISLAYMLGVLRLRGPAEEIFRRSERLADAGDPVVSAFSQAGRGMLHFVFARWAEGEAALAAARDICATHHQPQLIEVIATTQGIGAHLQGEGERALGHFDSLHGIAKARGSVLHTAWADYATAQTLLAMNRPHEGWARLVSAEDHLRGLSDRQSHHICQGLRARLAWSLGDIDDALAAAVACARTSRSLAPTNYTSTEAYSAPALIGALALLKGVSASQRRPAESLMNRGIVDLTSFALVFPIARPRLATIKALRHGLRHPRTAARRLAQVASKAEGAGLRFEAALARRIGDDMSLRF